MRDSRAKLLYVISTMSGATFSERTASLCLNYGPFSEEAIGELTALGIALDASLPEVACADEVLARWFKAGRDDALGEPLFSESRSGLGGMTI